MLQSFIFGALFGILIALFGKYIVTCIEITAKENKKRNEKQQAKEKEELTKLIKDAIISSNNEINKK